MMSPAMLEVLTHAMRADRGRMRGLYVTDPDDPDVVALVALGHMERAQCGIPMGGSVLFRVTPAGQAVVK